MANFDEYFLMKDLSKDLFNPLAGEDFVKMFDENYGSQETLQGYATKGTVKDIRGDFAMVDVGLKSEGRVPLKEFGASVPVVGDIIDVFVERYESREGTACHIPRPALKRHGKTWKRQLPKVSTQKVQLSMLSVVALQLTSMAYLHLCHRPRLTTNQSAMQNH